MCRTCQTNQPDRSLTGRGRASDCHVLALIETLERTRDATTLADVRELSEFRDLLDEDAIARAAGLPL